MTKVKSIIGEENVLVNEPLKNHTSFKIGGPCDYLLIPKDTERLVELIKLLKENGLDYFILGNGSNLLIKDKGIRGIVIKTDSLSKVWINNEEIIADSGVLLSSISRIAYNNSLSGLEFASGIPGTLGGAIYMNAGAYGGEVKDVVVETTAVNSNGELVVVKGEEHEFSYRKSIFQNNRYFIVKTKLKLSKGNKEEISRKMNELNFKRRDKQPLEFPSAGSVFKRPEGFFAGKLISDANLSGKTIGGAMVSEKHCGFIVNNGNATAKDVVDLIELVQSEVFNKFKVKLEPEIKIIGE